MCCTCGKACHCSAFFGVHVLSSKDCPNVPCHRTMCMPTQYLGCYNQPFWLALMQAGYIGFYSLHICLNKTVHSSCSASSLASPSLHLSVLV